MAVRGTARSATTAAGVAAAAAAAQLGLGYGLGVVTWLPDGGNAGWVNSLAWAVWIAATSTVAGALCADRLAAHRPTPTTPTTAVPARATLWHIVLATAAAVGALVTVVLVAVPARSAAPSGTGTPQSVAAGYAAIGVAVGLVAAFWALSSRPAAVNVIATSSWLWLLGIVAVIDGVVSGGEPVGARLGVWPAIADERFWFRDYLWPQAVVSLGSALVIAVVVAWSAARSSRARVGAAVSGAAGPLLVTAAYIITTPRLEQLPPEQWSAHLVAPYGVIVGLAGSVLVAALAARTEARAHARDVAAASAATTAGADGPVIPAQPSDAPASPTAESAGSAGDEQTDDVYAPARAYASDSPADTSTSQSGDGASERWPDPKGNPKPERKAKRSSRRRTTSSGGDDESGQTER